MEAKSGIRPGGIGYHTVIISGELSAVSYELWNTRIHYAVTIKTANKNQITHNLPSNWGLGKIPLRIWKRNQVSGLGYRYHTVINSVALSAVSCGIHDPIMLLKSNKTITHNLPSIWGLEKIH